MYKKELELGMVVTPVIVALGRQRQYGCRKFKANQIYLASPSAASGTKCEPLSGHFLEKKMNKAWIVIHTLVKPGQENVH